MSRKEGTFSDNKLNNFLMKWSSVLEVMIYFLWQL